MDCLQKLFKLPAEMKLESTCDAGLFSTCYRALKKLQGARFADAESFGAEVQSFFGGLLPQLQAPCL